MLKRIHPFAALTAIRLRLRGPCLAAMLAGLAISTVLLMGKPAIAAPKAVVEMFTSQGCSSCPPADALMGKLAGDDDLIVLSLPVDYWDYLGWRDTLARPQNSARQHAYAEKRGDRAVYTPQAVINGGRHVIGSDERAIDIAIRTGGGLPVDVDARLTGDALVVNIGAHDVSSETATVWLVLFDRAREVAIKRGENRGHTFVYHNVVRRMQAIGMWKGKAISIELPRVEIAKAGSRGCAVLVQKEDGSGRPGTIVGAVYLPRDLTKSAVR